MRVSIICAGISAFAASSIASATPAPDVAAEPEVTVPAAKDAKAKSPPDFGAMLAIVDKLFPPQPDPDPARLTLARTSVAAMWPEGSYSRMMTGFMGGMFDRVMQLKQSDFAAMGNKAPKVGASVPGKDLSLREQIGAKDPYFDQRMAAMRGVVTEELGKVSAIIDPRIRDGLARSMARRFDARQLTDINGFFATPSGRALAGQYMQIWLDPDMMRSLFSSMPEMMKLMPDMAQKLKAANDRFPKPPKSPESAKKKPSKP